MLFVYSNRFAIDSGRPAAARIKDGDGKCHQRLTVGADIYLDRTKSRKTTGPLDLRLGCSWIIKEVFASRPSQISATDKKSPASEGNALSAELRARVSPQ